VEAFHLQNEELLFYNMHRAILQHSHIMFLLFRGLHRKRQFGRCRLQSVCSVTLKWILQQDVRVWIVFVSQGIIPWWAAVNT